MSIFRSQVFLFGLFVLFIPKFVFSENMMFELKIENHMFYPSELIVPAGVKLRLLIVNQEDTPEEFESYELNREKVILGGKKTVIFIGPLKSGIYPFFGEFNMATAQGKVIAK